MFEGRFFVYQSINFIIWDHNQGIYNFLHLFKSFFSIDRPFLSLKAKRLRNDTNRKDSHTFCDTCNNWSGPSSSSSPHSSSNENHISILHYWFEIHFIFFCWLSSDFRVCSSSESFRNIESDIYFLLCKVGCKILRISIYRNKLYSCQSFLDHSIEGFISAPPYSKDFNLCSWDKLRHNFIDNH